MITIKKVVVTYIQQSHSTGTTLIRAIPYDQKGELDGNRAYAGEFHGIPGLVNAPDFRSEWYGYGIKTLIPIPEAGRIFFNSRGGWRKSFIKRVRRVVNARAKKAGVRVEWALPR